MLLEHLGPQTRLVVELGSFLGVSARTILTAAPHATLICVDHWRGSPEHQPGAGNPEWSRRLPMLYETFLRNLWPWRGRVIPLKADTLEGLDEIAAAGLTPELVYVDSEHTFERVKGELALIGRHWPAAAIVGDDYNHPAVAAAARQYAAATGRTLMANATAFCFP